MPWWAWAGIAAVAIAAAIAIPLSVTAAEHTAALDAYRQSTSTAAEAADTATKTAAELAAKSKAAVAEADALQAIVDQTPADLVADPATRDAAAAAIAQLRTSATHPAIDVPAIAEWGSSRSRRQPMTSTTRRPPPPLTRHDSEPGQPGRHRAGDDQ